MSLFEELQRRGVIYQYSDGFEEFVRGGKGGVYLGIDPTAPSLHVGNLVPLITLLRFAIAGFDIYLVGGGGTCCVGDPAGKSQERELMDIDVINSNLASILHQLERIVRNAGVPSSKVHFVDNARWLKEITLIDFLRDIGKHFSMAYLISKEGIQNRIKTGISYAEFSYALLQSYDFYYLYKEYGVKCQIGGSDQWGNITAGIELIRRKLGGDAYGMTTPLLTDSSGRKLGKSEEGTIYLDAKLTSPYKLYQFFINLDDETSIKLLYFLGMESVSDIEEVAHIHNANPEKRIAQKHVGRSVVSLVHSREISNSVERVSGLLFGEKGRDVDSLTDTDIEILKSEIPSVSVGEGEISDGVNVLDIMLKGNIISSKNEGRGLIKQGAVTINGQPIQEPITITREHFGNRGFILIQRGKKHHMIVTLDKSKVSV